MSAQRQTATVPFCLILNLCVNGLSKFYNVCVVEFYLTRPAKSYLCALLLACAKSISRAKATWVLAVVHARAMQPQTRLR